MTHATEGTLQAWLDGELAEAAGAELAGHLAECAACAAEADALRAIGAQAGRALGLLDTHAPSAVALRSVRQRAAAPPRVTTAPRRRAAGMRGSLSRAAGLVLLTVGAASAAIPGSPVRAWLTGAWDRVSSLFAGERPEPVLDSPAAAPVAVEEAYAAVALADGQVRVLLAQPAGAATIRVRMIDGNRARFYSTDTGVRYVSATGRLEIGGIGSGDVTIELPRGARFATVELAGERVAQVENGALHALVPAVSASAAELVFRAGQ